MPSIQFVYDLGDRVTTDLEVSGVVISLLWEHNRDIYGVQTLMGTHWYDAPRLRPYESKGEGFPNSGG